LGAHLVETDHRDRSSRRVKGIDEALQPMVMPDCVESVSKYPLKIPMLFIVIERFREGQARPVYERFAERGRMAPEGLTYVNSWVTDDLAVCYQVMEGTRAQLDEWIANWADLVDFEVHPAITSAEARQRALR
jgi:hypothetical protein